MMGSLKELTTALQTVAAKVARSVDLLGCSTADEMVAETAEWTVEP